MGRNNKRGGQGKRKGKKNNNNNNNNKKKNNKKNKNKNSGNKGKSGSGLNTSSAEAMLRDVFSKGGGAGNLFPPPSQQEVSFTADYKPFEQLTSEQLDDLWDRINAPEAHDDESYEIWPDLAQLKQRRHEAAAEGTTSFTTVDTDGSADTHDAVASEATMTCTGETHVARDGSVNELVLGTQLPTDKEKESAPTATATAVMTMSTSMEHSTPTPTTPTDTTTAIEHPGNEVGGEKPVVTEDKKQKEKEDEKQFVPITDYDSSEEDVILGDILYPETLMPAVSERSMDDVLGVPSEGGAPSLLSRILNPDSGGKGKNKTGLQGLVAQEQPEMTPRERLRQRRQAMHRARMGLSRDQYVYDKKGRRVKGARQVTMQDVQAGLVPRSQLRRVDKEATRDQIRRNIEKMRADMAAKKQREKQQPPLQQESSTIDSGEMQVGPVTI